MGCYLFNTRGRNHKKLFGDDAVFDLDWPAQDKVWGRVRIGEAGRLLQWADKPKGKERAKRSACLVLLSKTLTPF